MSEEIQISEWSWPETQVETVRGMVPYRLWCEREMARQNKNGRHVRIGQHKAGMICLVGERVE